MWPNCQNFRVGVTRAKICTTIMSSNDAHCDACPCGASEMEMVLRTLRLSYIAVVSGKTKAAQYSDLASDDVSRAAGSAALL